MDERIILVTIKFIIYCIRQTIKNCYIHCTFIKIIILMQLLPKIEDSLLQHSENLTTVVQDHLMGFVKQNKFQESELLFSMGVNSLGKK